jgi:hypothetical protein
MLSYMPEPIERPAHLFPKIGNRSQSSSTNVRFFVTIRRFADPQRRSMTCLLAGA